MIDYIVNAFKLIWDWLLLTVKGLIDALFEPIAEALPSLSGGWSLSGIVGFFGFCNTWVALDWGVACLVAYFVFLGVMLAIKFAMKLIPTMPG